MALPRGSPLVTLNNVHLEVKANRGEFFAAKVNITGGKDVTIEDLLRRTDGMLKEDCPQGYVQTRTFREAVRMLNQHGVCAIIGRPGQGKTALAHALLRHYRETESYRPCIILSPPEVASVPYPRDWEDVREDEKYVVLLDDMLGSSNLLPSLLDQWSESRLPALWPKIASGQVKVIATFRPHIYKMAAARLKKSQVFGRGEQLDLHDQTLQLTSLEKKSIFQNFASKYGRSLPEQSKEGEGLLRSMELSADIGFPACCRLFVTSSIHNDKMEAFFAYPVMFILSQLKELRDCDPDSYLAMVFLMVKGGRIHRSRLRTREISAEDRDLVDMLKESIPRVDIRSLGTLSDRLEKLSGLFLDHSSEDDVITFSHQSVMDALFVFYCKKENLRDALELCPVSLLVQYVRTESKAESTSTEKSGDVTQDDDVALVVVDRQLWPLLGKRLLTEMKSDLDLALSHPSLGQAGFVDVMMSKCLEDVDVEHLCLLFVETRHCRVPVLDYHRVSLQEEERKTCRHGQTVLQWRQSTMSEHVFWRQLEVYQHDVALAAMIERGLPYLALSLLRRWLPESPRKVGTSPIGSMLTSLMTSGGMQQRAHLHMEMKDILTTLLAVATRAAEIDIAHALLKRKAVVTKETLRAACSSLTEDVHLLRSLLTQLDREHLSPGVLRDLLCLTAQNYRLSSFQVLLEHVCQWDTFFKEAKHVMHVLILQGHAGLVRSSPCLRSLSQKTALSIRHMLVTMETAATSHLKVKPRNHLVAAFAHEIPSVLEWLLDRLSSEFVISNDNHSSGQKVVATAVSAKTIAMETKENNLVHVAAKFGCVETLRFLRDRWPLAFCMASQQPNSSGQTPLFLAASRARAEVVEFLIQTRNDVRIQDTTGNTWMHAAAACYGPRSLATLRCLELSQCKYLDLNCLNTDGISPLLVAAQRGNEDVVRFFLDKGALVNGGHKDAWGNTWLHYATSSGLLPFLSCLFRLADVDVNVANDNGDTPLHVAAGSPMKFFRAGAGVAHSGYLEQPLPEVIRVGTSSHEVRGTRMLYTRPPRSQSTSKSNEVTLSHLTSTPSLLSLQFLLTLPSVDLNAENLQGKSPRDVALQNRQYELARLLGNKGADVVRKSAVSDTSVLESAIRHATSTSFALDGVDRAMKSQSGAHVLKMVGCKMAEASVDLDRYASEDEVENEAGKHEDPTRTPTSGSSKSSTEDSDDSSGSEDADRKSLDSSLKPLGRAMKSRFQKISSHDAEGGRHRSEPLNQGDARLTRTRSSASKTTPSEEIEPVDVSDSGSEEIGGNASHESLNSDEEETPRFGVSSSDEEMEEASFLSSESEESRAGESSEKLSETLYASSGEEREESSLLHSREENGEVITKYSDGTTRERVLRV